MEELSIEEKAKAYDEALERARVWKEKSGMSADKQGILDDIFPELKESEDEKIRKSLIILLQHFCKGYRVPGLDFPVSYKDMLAWLEKQGESYTKRDVDDAWLEGMVCAKNELEKQAEVVSDKDDIEAEEKGIRKAFNKIWEEKQDKQKSQRMISAEAKEAMYDKPADKVEPKCEESKAKIFDAPTPFEDKLYAFVLACEILVDSSKREFILEHSQEILDAAREQIGKEQSSTWSEEDEKTIHNIDAAIRHEVVFPINELKLMEIWLESLKYRIRSKHEWKRDEKMFQLIEDIINVYRKTQGSVIGGVHIEELKDFLNCMSSRQDWKPSDEQMATLYKYAEQNNYDGSILTSLYNDLKKLREE